MGLNFHENPLDDLPIIIWDRSFLCYLDCFSSFPSNKQNISSLKHNKSCSDSIFTRRNNPKVISFFPMNTCTYFSNNLIRVFCISIIIRENNNIR